MSKNENKNVNDINKSKQSQKIDMYYVIETLMTAKVKFDNKIECDSYNFDNCESIVNCILRNYRIPKERIYISKRAKEKCEIFDLGNNDIMKIFTNGYNSFMCKNTNKKIRFNTMFTVDHIIPISKLTKKIKTAIESNNYNVELLKSLLDKMTICIMLKEEHKSIKKQSDREFDVNKVIEEVYKNCNIEVQKI